MSKRSSYLDRLPKAASRRGSADRGEIEIVTGRRSRREIESECADELTGGALGKRSKRTGILLEDDVHMVVRDAVRFPSGATGCQMRIVGKTGFDGPNGVVALAESDGRFVFREIFRHATRSWELEAIRGRRESGQSARQAVRTEVKQELGYPVRRVERLGTICPDAAVMASTLEIFLVELGRGPRKDEPEEGEAFGEVVRLTRQELDERILAGEIRDSYTVAALTLLDIRRRQADSTGESETIALDSETEESEAETETASRGAVEAEAVEAEAVDAEAVEGETAEPEKAD
ncbi:MAG TPA: NUDIX domain-containing protein [Gemmatimonadaceae bacterium]|nr:NUDIX domain-containing protein [Gemmatimonadaceae bacterium]